MLDLITFILICIAIGGAPCFVLGIITAIAWQRWTVHRSLDEMHEQIASDEQAVSKVYGTPGYWGKP